MPPTTPQRRAHYDDFVAQVIKLCAVNGIRSDLISGRGRPQEDCARMSEHLAHRIAGFGAHRAHYTVASLIAMQRDLPHEDGPYLPEVLTPAADDTGTECLAQADTDPTAADEDTDRAYPNPAGEYAESAAARPKEAARPWRARPNLGTSLAIAVARHGFDRTRTTGQFKTLTRLSAPLLHPALWRLASRLHDRDAARLDFAVLLEDLAWWDYDQRQIAARWRDSYFITLHTLAPAEDD